MRKCEFYDGAEPSGNAVHAENLLRLHQITQNPSYLKQAEETLKSAKHYIQIYPPGACYHLIALQRYLDVKAPSIVIALDEAESLKNEIHDYLNSHYLPHAAIVWKSAKDTALDALLPIHVDKKPIDGQTAIYICRQDRCEAPLIEKGQILQAIEAL